MSDHGGVELNYCSSLDRRYALRNLMSRVKSPQMWASRRSVQMTIVYHFGDLPHKPRGDGDLCLTSHTMKRHD